MAVFTAVALDDLSDWLANFPLGKPLHLRGIASGIENTNYFLTTERGEYVLTIFEKLGFDQLPFYLELMRHLANRGILVPAPIANVKGEILHALRGKPAAIVSKLEGKSQMQPQPLHCAQVGSMLARMHQAASDFGIRQPNLRGLEWWRATAPEVLPYLDPERQHLLREQVELQRSFADTETYRRLPAGPIHADLFRNNVMFADDQLTGFFDFYFAGCDTWVFDVAVTVNDWCSDPASGELDETRVRALLDAYNVERPFTPAERDAWPLMLRAGALRFWISRLYDFYLPREAEMLTPHDPGEFERILRLRIQHPVPPLS